MRKVRNNTEPEVIPYVSTYNPRNAELFGQILNNIPILQNDERMKAVLQKHPIIKSKRQSKSLKTILTNAKLSTVTDIPKVTKCNRFNCGVCAYLIEGSEFKFKTGHIFRIKNNFSCYSENLIYVITCKGCGEHYIGQTGNTLRQRMTVHRQQIRVPYTRMISLSEHISNCAGSTIPNYYIFPIYQCAPKTTEDQRINKEKLFILKYNPVLNRTNSSI